MYRRHHDLTLNIKGQLTRWFKYGLSPVRLLRTSTQPLLFASFATNTTYRRVVLYRYFRVRLAETSHFLIHNFLLACSHERGYLPGKHKYTVDRRTRIRTRSVGVHLFESFMTQWHVLTDTRPSRFLARSIKKLGVAWGRG